METTQTDKSEGAEVKHSPLPWSCDTIPPGVSRIHSSTGMKTLASGLSRKDAAFVVRACNSHDKLIEALKNCALALEQSYDATEWPANGSSNQEITSRQARKLIAEVEAS